MVRTMEKMGSEVLTAYFLIHRSQTVFHCIIMIHHQEATVRRLCQISSPLFSTLIIKESLLASTGSPYEVVCATLLCYDHQVAI